MTTKELTEKNNYMTTDDLAALLVKLYAEYRVATEDHNDDYAKAVGITIRMLID